MVEEIVKVYRQAIQDKAGPGDPDAERSQSAAHLRKAAPVFYSAYQAQKETQTLRNETQTLREETQTLRQRVPLVTAQLDRARADLARIRGLPLVRQGGGQDLRDCRTSRNSYY